MGVDMPLCSRRAWTTFQGPVDPSRLPTCPPQVATTTASSFHAFNPDTQAGRRRVFIMTTIQTQRPTLLYVSQFYPDKTRTTVPVLSRHSQLRTRSAAAASGNGASIHKRRVAVVGKNSRNLIASQIT